MDERTRVALAVVFTVALFLTVQLGALALAPTFDDQGYQATENPDDATNSLVYVGVILVATAGMLGLIKLGAEQVIRAIVLVTTGLLSSYVLIVVLGRTLGPLLGAQAVPWLAVGGGVLIVAALLVHPEWYVIDAAGVLMAAGAAGLFGISFGILPALVLLVALAVYDAVSVYGTEHMLTLAEGVMDLDVPILLVVPTTLSFSMADVAGAEEAATDGPAADGRGSGVTDDSDGPIEQGAIERDALFLGLGDVVIPTVLVASAGFFLQRQTDQLISGFALNLPALGAMIGTIAGLLALLGLVFRGRPHAGLPLLNGGAIVGYLVGAVAAGIPLTTALGL